MRILKILNAIIKKLKLKKLKAHENECINKYIS